MWVCIVFLRVPALRVRSARRVRPAGHAFRRVSSRSRSLESRVGPCPCDVTTNMLICKVLATARRETVVTVNPER